MVQRVSKDPFERDIIAYPTSFVAPPVSVHLGWLWNRGQTAHHSGWKFLPPILKDRRVFLQTLPQFHHPAHMLPGTWSVSGKHILNEWLDDWMRGWTNEVLPALFPTASSHFTLQTLCFSQIGWLWVAADSIWLCFIEHLCAELRVWLTSCVIITNNPERRENSPILQMRKMRLTETITSPWMCSQWESALGFKTTCPSWRSVFIPPCCGCDLGWRPCT